MTLVNWDEIDPKYKWAAMDNIFHEVLVFTHRPTQIDDEFVLLGDTGECRIVASGVDTSDWLNSLEERPK